MNDLISSINTTWNKVKNQRDITKDTEVEFRLGSYDRDIRQWNLQPYPQTEKNIFRFNQLIRNLEKFLNNAPEMMTLLDIYPIVPIVNGKLGEKIRITLKDNNDITRYCKTNSLSGTKYGILVKDKIPSTDVVGYNAVMSASIEKDKDDYDIKQVADVKKSFRLKRRFTFKTNSGNQYDLTLVKHAIGFNIYKSKLLNKKESYEAEMEVSVANINKIVKSKTNKLPKDVYSDLYILLAIYQSTYVPISNDDSNKIIMKYVETVFNNKMTINLRSQTVNKKPYFIGMNVRPIELYDLYQDAEGIRPIDNMKLALTEKADGERRLLIINDGGVVLMDNNLVIYKLPLLYTPHNTTPKQSLGDNISSSYYIFDGELIDNGKGSLTYLIFDCLWYEEDIRNYPLLSKSGKSRYSYIMKFINGMVPKISKDEHDPMNISIVFKSKNYVEISSSIDDQTQSTQYNMDKAIDLVYNKTYEYELDGLIFTPYDESYPIKETKLVKNRETIIQTEWKNLMKWKPIEQLSNDFLVKETSKTVLYTPQNTTPKQSLGDSITIKYVEYTLYVRDRDHIVKFIPDKVKFESSTYIKSNERGHPITESGEIIYNDAVIEFIYDTKKEKGFRWIPLRYRYDKTYNEQPNNIKTALSNWDLIQNNITIDQVKGLSKVDRPYYEIKYNKKYKDILAPMTTFHNKVKTAILNPPTKNKPPTQDIKPPTPLGDNSRGDNSRGDNITKQLLLDIGSGQGGDLWKWQQYREVVGIEPDKDNIKHANDRLDNIKKIRKDYNVEITFLHGDAGRVMNNGDAAIEDRNVMIKALEYKKGKFDVCSCNFVIHYLFESDKKLHTLMYNVAVNLRIGGKFVGACLDGHRLLDLVKDDGVDGEIQYKKPNYEYPIWALKLDKDLLESIKPPTPLGDKIQIGSQYNVFMSSIGLKWMSEYLVDLDYLIEVSAKFGLVKKEIKPFEEWYDELNMTINDPKLREYSFLHSSFIFEKKEDIKLNKELKKMIFK